MSKSIKIIVGIIVIVFVSWAGFTYLQKPSEIGRSQNTNSSDSVGAGQSTNSDTRQEGAVPQSGDPCGGTGGNGKITSVGSNTFTLKLRTDRSVKGSGMLIVSLTNSAMIKTANGNVSLSDLKTGDHVTLVGDNHRDGTFTADMVAVCTTTGLGTQSTQ